MKATKLVSILIFMTITFQISAQKSKEEPPSNPGENWKVRTLDHYEDIYSLAVSYGDFASASNAIYGILAFDTANLAWKDSLASLMFARGALEQCLRLSKEVYTADNSNLRMLELLAVSEQGLSNAKESLEYYETLYAQTQNIFHLYQIATLQFGLQRLGECSANLEKIIQDPKSETETVSINVGQGYSQQVPYKAAALNIIGVIARSLNDNESAKKAFEDALKIFPEFILAQGNLDEMNKPVTTDGEKK